MGLTISGATPIIKSRQSIEVTWTGGTTKVVPLPSTVNKDNSLVEVYFTDSVTSSTTMDGNSALPTADFQDNDNVLLERDTADANDYYYLVIVTEYENVRSKQVITKLINTDLSATPNPSVDETITSVNKDNCLVVGSRKVELFQPELGFFGAGYYLTANTTLRIKVQQFDYSILNGSQTHKVQILEFN